VISERSLGVKEICQTAVKRGKMKITGDNPQTGIYFEKEDGSQSFKVSENDIIVNNPSELIVAVPPLAAGRYRLVIRTQYAVGAMLKKIRTEVFEKILTVG
jgi:hypothetical protein